MAVTPNPFTPTFGVSPPLLVGRDEELAAFAEALDNGPGSPGRAMLFTGRRGCGKTVMLNAVEDLARQRGWLVVSETTRPGVAREMVHTTLPTLLKEFGDEPVEHQVTGVNVSGIGFGAGVSRQRKDRHPVTASLRSELAELTDSLSSDGTGVLISLDEVHSAAIRDLREIAQAVQHGFREGRDIAFVAAGLPSAVSDALNDSVLTFLRRAERFTMTAVSPAQVRQALREPIVQAGRTITDEALDVAATATKGYPFLVQLVGYQTWSAATGSTITAADAQTGARRAGRRVGTLVHEPALARLSGVDRAFLAAMAVDDGPSRMADIATRLGVDANYASQYRRRLIAAEMIEPVRYGTVDFTLPYLREQLRSQAQPS